jgi:hypothetical protein
VRQNLIGDGNNSILDWVKANFNVNLLEPSKLLPSVVNAIRLIARAEYRYDVRIVIIVRNRLPKHKASVLISYAADALLYAVFSI